MVSTEVINAPETKDVILSRTPSPSFRKSYMSIVEDTFFDEDDMDANVLQPPTNFAMVAEGVYRSGYPTVKNLTFLRKLNLKSIVYLCPEEYPPAMKEFIEDNRINVFHFGLLGNKVFKKIILPVMRIPERAIKDVLVHVLDVRNHPMLIHCNRGKHRTGCVVGCLRKEQQWSLSSIIEEYNMYAGDKVRSLDQQFIRNFNMKVPYDPFHLPVWLDYLELD